MAHEVSDPVLVPPRGAAEAPHPNHTPNHAPDTLAALEASLRERELELKEARTIANLGTWSWERSTGTTTWSDEIYAIFGRTRETYTPRSVTELRNLPNVPATWIRLLDLHQRAIDTGEPYEADIEIEHSDGSKRWIVSRGHAARWEGGQVVSLRGTVQDITDRKLVELALEERERAHREAQRIGRMGSWHWVLATNELTWSEEVYSLMERDPSLPVIMFSDHPEMFEGDSLQQLQSAIDHGIANRAAYSVDCWMRLPSGKRICFATRGEPIVDPNGNLIELRGTVRDITDRKLIEEELQRSENRYKSLVHASSDIVWVTNPHVEQLIELPAWQAFTGQTLEELLGLGWLEAIHPEDRERTTQAWSDSLASGATFQMEHRLRRHDGVYRTMSVRAVPSFDAHGNIVEWVGMHTDITERIEAEEAVRESQARFQRLYDSDLIGIGFPDAAGKIHDCNDALLRIIGYTREDLRAGLVRWDLMTPPEYRELDLAHIQESHSRGSCTPYRKEYIRKDGSRVPVMIGFARLEGEKAESIGFVMDLTAQKQAEEATREREERFSALADTIPQLVWMSDRDGNKIYANRRFLEYTGISADAVTGPMWDGLVHPDDFAHFSEVRHNAMLTGEPFLAEYRIRRHDGVFRTFLARAVPVRDNSGEVDRWLGGATDIHDQKLAEEALRRSEKLAATGRLAASIAHEINNPLEAVTNALYLALLDASLNETTRTYLKVAEQELSRVAQVTTQTLRFHRQSVAAIEVDLSEIMDSAFSLFAPRFEACAISVERDYMPGNLLYCRGDEIRQVFANFLSNALDATRVGGRIRIRIRRTGTWCDNPGLRVTIADTGHGIPANLRRTIFEPFISTKETTGTGLGLWVSDGIVQKHKGHIALRSRTGEPHHGTVFSLFFPLEGIKAA